MANAHATVTLNFMLEKFPTRARNILLSHTVALADDIDILN